MKKGKPFVFNDETLPEYLQVPDSILSVRGPARQLLIGMFVDSLRRRWVFIPKGMSEAAGSVLILAWDGHCREKGLPCLVAIERGRTCRITLTMHKLTCLSPAGIRQAGVVLAGARSRGTTRPTITDKGLSVDVPSRDMDLLCPSIMDLAEECWEERPEEPYVFKPMDSATFFAKDFRPEAVKNWPR